jgi:hypothetical protein
MISKSASLLSESQMDTDDWISQITAHDGICLM